VKLIPFGFINPKGPAPKIYFRFIFYLPPFWGISQLLKNLKRNKAFLWRMDVFWRSIFWIWCERKKTSFKKKL